MLLNILYIIALQFFGFSASDQPEFKGGRRNLDIFINSNLLYPEFSKENCIEGIVQVSFKLNSKGRIYDSEVEKGFGIDLDDEALRVVRLSSGRWIVPAGYDTTQAIILPVNFSLKGYKCEERTKDQINEAINAYHARANLSNAIFNFYDKKSTGDYDAADELRIIALKQQLGYDEKYIDRLLRQAQRKLKQGDLESACDDLHTIRKLGSDKATGLIEQNCK
ncbi:TonB family protein [Daejeonella oryzae]|uniref:TonB family protein n=1 Tax=Daejeonella oryzae TaxID=1122943 RepID=UPI0003F9C3A4|nr:TonB family protein [Daejeonella oryzae]